MANPTTNYGFVLPTPTDLVTDLPADFEVALQAVDTQMLTNANAAVAKTIVDAKGDIIAATAADTVSRLAVGANDTVLTADSSTATGLKWAVAPGGGSTNIAQIATGSLSGTQVTLTSLSTYSVLILKLVGVGCATSNRLSIRVNGSGSSVYDFQVINQRGSTTYGDLVSDSTQFYVNDGYAQTGSANDSFWRFDNCSSTGFTQMTFQSNYTSAGADTTERQIGIFKSAAAVSSLEINSDQTWTSGTYTLFGA
jgi:hypothetical protein